MRPLKAASGLSNWLIRLTLIFFIFTFHFHHILDFQPISPLSYVAAAYVLFGLLLLIGAFLKRNSLTVFSGFVLFVLSCFFLVKMILFYFQNDISFLPSESNTGNNNEILVYLLSTSCSLYFLVKGNKS